MKNIITALVLSMAIVGCSSDKVESAEVEVEESNTTPAKLYMACTPKIQEQLVNPKSFDPDPLTIKATFAENMHIVGFKFYAKNSFGGEIIQQGICSFDEDANFLEYEIV